VDFVQPLTLTTNPANNMKNKVFLEIAKIK